MRHSLEGQDNLRQERNVCCVYVAGWVGGLGYPFPRIFGIDYYYLNTYSIDDSFDFYCMYVILDYYTVPII